LKRDPTEEIKEGSLESSPLKIKWGGGKPPIGAKITPKEISSKYGKITGPIPCINLQCSGDNQKNEETSFNIMAPNLDLMSKDGS
jgi:hypothetical protein